MRRTFLVLVAYSLHGPAYAGELKPTRLSSFRPVSSTAEYANKGHLSSEVGFRYSSLKVEMPAENEVEKYQDEQFGLKLGGFYRLSAPLMLGLAVGPSTTSSGFYGQDSSRVDSYQVEPMAIVSLGGNMHLGFGYTYGTYQERYQLQGMPKREDSRVSYQTGSFGLVYSSGSWAMGLGYRDAVRKDEKRISISEPSEISIFAETLLGSNTQLRLTLQDRNFTILDGENLSHKRVGLDTSINLKPDVQLELGALHGFDSESKRLSLVPEASPTTSAHVGADWNLNRGLSVGGGIQFEKANQKPAEWTRTTVSIHGQLSL